MRPRDALLARGRAQLAGLADPMREARTLLAHAAGVGRDRLHDLDDDRIAEVAPRFEALVASRAGGRPLSRILGYREFWTHRFEIGDDVLDPRADTETLVARALDLDWASCLDLGTGSGCVLLSLLSERKDARGVGTDVSDGALGIAARNARALGLEGRSSFLQSDWYAHVTGRFDLIVSNPPYIALDEMEGLSPDVRGHDPRGALTDEADGLGAYRRIVEGARDHLHPGGWLAVEIGWRQRGAVQGLFEAAGFRSIACHADLEGRDRVVLGLAG
ncbi:peptide chain release factor N(5)-glutamine methyltransferase [Palleronia sp. LCG004]|uniref:peptide chain release factor N(5)-glutamine methyltransferase n=1 Tax=Palleronia sp. LCG004 TaxID=3079304 RepID=UPI002943CEC3|nr:peptide chain release factor N(5)-glutamine methyltransferase [Palleronia sp. LCG004]WOI55210.1 peptide chain release factor N(5)-glutamine methyltransferase [Palleronia sp. LCG004]